MNLSADWLPALQAAGYEATHWTAYGLPDAPDTKLMQWALEHGYVLFTQDLDFTDILAISGTSGPSVLQLRGDNRPTEATLRVVLGALATFADELERGALVTVSRRGARARVLPLR